MAAGKKAHEASKSGETHRCEAVTSTGINMTMSTLMPTGMSTVTAARLTPMNTRMRTFIRTRTSTATAMIIRSAKTVTSTITPITC